MTQGTSRIMIAATTPSGMRMRMIPLAIEARSRLTALRSVGPDADDPRQAGDHPGVGRRQVPWAYVAGCFVLTEPGSGSGSRPPPAALTHGLAAEDCYG
jgi:hypothetical protein